MISVGTQQSIQNRRNTHLLSFSEVMYEFHSTITSLSWYQYLISGTEDQKLTDHISQQLRHLEPQQNINDWNSEMHSKNYVP